MSVLVQRTICPTFTDTFGGSNLSPPVNALPSAFTSAAGCCWPPLEDVPLPEPYWPSATAAGVERLATAVVTIAALLVRPFIRSLLRARVPEDWYYAGRPSAVR